MHLEELHQRAAHGHIILNDEHCAIRGFGRARRTLGHSGFGQGIITSSSPRGGATSALHGPDPTKGGDSVAILASLRDRRGDRPHGRGDRALSRHQRRSRPAEANQPSRKHHRYGRAAGGAVFEATLVVESGSYRRPTLRVVNMSDRLTV